VISEDPIIRMLQKGKQFQELMGITYHNLIKNQGEEEKNNYKQLPEYLKLS